MIRICFIETWQNSLRKAGCHNENRKPENQKQTKKVVVPGTGNVIAPVHRTRSYISIVFKHTLTNIIILYHKLYEINRTSWNVRH